MGKVKQAVQYLLNYMNTKPDVKMCKGKLCTFVDGTELEIDAIALATGATEQVKR